MIRFGTFHYNSNLAVKKKACLNEQIRFILYFDNILCHSYSMKNVKKKEIYGHSQEKKQRNLRGAGGFFIGINYKSSEAG